MTKHAKGTFEVKMAPQPADANVGDPSIGRFGLDKQFQGELVGTSRGQMLAVRDARRRLGGVRRAREVEGRSRPKGAFVLQHNGLMDREPSLTITIVPDSGTGELSGSPDDDDRERGRTYDRVHAGRIVADATSGSSAGGEPHGARGPAREARCSRARARPWTYRAASAIFYEPVVNSRDLGVRGSNAPSIRGVEAEEARANRQPRRARA